MSEHRILEEILERLIRIERNQEKLMTTQAEFDASLDALIAAEATRDAAVTAALNDLIAKVNSGATIDLSAELEKVATLQANAAALTQTATGDDPGSTTVPTTPIKPAA